MQGKYLKKLGGIVLAALMLAGLGFASAATAEAQGRRRVIIVRPGSHRFYRPFNRYDVFGYDRWGYDRWGRDRWGNYRFGYDPWSPFGNRYSQYVFDNGDKAVNAGYKQGFKTGKDDGKKSKSFSPERSHYFKEAGFGNFGEAYRAGFSRGYRDGYRVGSDNRAG